MSNTDTDFNLDALLDGTLDDLADVPGFEPFPPGAHRVTIKWEKVKDKPAYSLRMTLIEHAELASADSKQLAAGTQASVLYKLDNEYGQSAFRKVIASLGNSFGPGSNREIMDKSNGAECLIVTKLRKGKDDKKDQEYLDLVEIAVV